MNWHVATRRALTLSAAIIAQTLTASNAGAHGYEPIRFTTPVSLGGQGEAYQRSGEWQFTVAYRRLVSNEWFIGTKENSALAPGGEAPVFRIHTFVADAAYGGSRPDVAGVFGDRFRESGFGLRVGGLPPGTYDLALFAWSTARQAWLPAKLVTITVR